MFGERAIKAISFWMVLLIFFGVMTYLLASLNSLSVLPSVWSQDARTAFCVMMGIEVFFFSVCVGIAYGQGAFK
jgi:uncharacterized membrane protein (UPF0182 family)